MVHKLESSSPPLQLRTRNAQGQLKGGQPINIDPHPSNSILWCINFMPPVVIPSRALERRVEGSPDTTKNAEEYNQARLGRVSVLGAELSSPYSPQCSLDKAALSPGKGTLCKKDKLSWQVYPGAVDSPF